MLEKIIHILSPIEGEIDVIKTDDILKSLVDYFSVFPKNGRIYKDDVCKINDITPTNDAEINALSQEKEIHVVLYAGDDIAGNLFQSFIFGLFGKKEQTSTLKNTRTTSPNNQLSERSNEARTNARIPDIYGTVRSTPDLIASPYRIYENHQEIEISYMCIGRGHYDVTDIKDGDTLASSINGTSIEIYAPNTSPNSGTAQITIGEAIDDPLVTTTRINEVNGQVLYAPNQNTLSISARAYDNTQSYPSYPETSFEYFLEHASPNVWGGSFEVGQTIIVENAVYDYGGGTLDLSGTYLIKDVTEYAIVLDNPQLTNPNWEDIETEYAPEHRTEYLTIDVKLDLEREVGAFILDSTDIYRVYINVIANNGLYKESNSGQMRVDVNIQILLQPINGAGANDGSLETYNDTIQGSNTLKSTRAKTIKINPATNKRYKITIKRTSDTDNAFNGNVVDEVKLQDIYIVKSVSNSHFGNVTTVYSKVLATDRATSVKNRKLNMLVTRKIPQRTTGTSFSGTLYATSRADEIICAIALDPYIGGLTVSSLDVDNIYDTVQDVEDYFDTEKATEFNYTFDDDNLSFEEMITTIAKAIHCTPYRQNSKIKLSFEQETELPILLFNHRNKIPKTEQRSIKFGTQSDFDGVELTYTDPADDAQVEFYIPYDKSAKNPKKVTATGIRNKIQAYFLAWREYNKILHERVLVEFDALQEANLLVVRDRILIADNTRADVIDGEIVDKSGLTLTLSQSMTFVSGKTYKIFLQLPSGQVESITITAGADAYKVVLGTAPSEALVYGADKYASTTYLIVANDDVREKAFLLQEKTEQSNFISKIKCVNYDDRYYQNDKDYENEIIDINGNVI